MRPQTKQPNKQLNPSNYRINSYLISVVVQLVYNQKLTDTQVVLQLSNRYLENISLGVLRAVHVDMLVNITMRMISITHQ